MNNLTQQFIIEQGNTYAEAINDVFLEQCNQFMIQFLSLPSTYVDGNGETFPTTFNQSYAWTIDAGYMLQTSSSLDNGKMIHEMSMYKKEVSKFFEVKATYNVKSEDCEAPVKKEQPQNTEAVPLENDEIGLQDTVDTIEVTSNNSVPTGVVSTDGVGQPTPVI